MKIHVHIEGEGYWLAIKSNLKPTYFTLSSGEHVIELEDKEVLVLHDSRHNPNFPTQAEEVSNLPPGVIVVPEPEPAETASTQIADPAI